VSDSTTTPSCFIGRTPCKLISLVGQNYYNNQWYDMDCGGPLQSVARFSYYAPGQNFNNVENTMTYFECEVDTRDEPNFGDDFRITPSAFDEANKNIVMSAAIA
jgi:hypothetical protein